MAALTGLARLQARLLAAGRLAAASCGGEQSSWAAAGGTAAATRSWHSSGVASGSEPRPAQAAERAEPTFAEPQLAQSTPAMTAADGARFTARLTPNKRIKLRLQAALQNEHFRDVISMFRDAVDSGQLLPDTDCYNYYIIALLRTGAHYTKGLSMLEQMNANGVPPSPTTYNTLIKMCTRYRGGQVAEKLVAEMESNGISPLYQVYSQLVTAFCLDSKLDKAMRYFLDMKNKGFVPTRSAYNELVQSLVRERQMDTAQLVIRHMREDRMPMSVAAHGDLISQAAELHLAAPMHESLQALYEDTYLSMDEGTIQAVLGAAVRAADVKLAKLAWNVLKRSFQMSRKPLASTYHAYIAALSAGRDFEAAFPALQELLADYPEERNETASPLRLGSLVNACCHSLATIDQVSQLLDPLGASISDVIVSRINHLVNNNYCAMQAYFSLEQLNLKGNIIDVACLNAIVAACAQARDMDRAFQTFDEYERTFNVQPDLGTFHALMYGCGQLGQPDSVFALFDDLRAAGMEPTGTTYDLIAEACLVVGDNKAAVAAVDDMLGKGLFPSRRVVVALLDRCRRNEDQESLQHLAPLSHRLKHRDFSETIHQRRVEIEHLVANTSNGHLHHERRPHGGRYNDYN
eukprot:jgi/Chlat1/9116/Chrsp97S08422